MTIVARVADTGRVAITDQLRDQARTQTEPFRSAFLTIIECHEGYHECPDRLQRPLQVFDYECPTLLALADALGVVYESGISQAT